MTVNLFFTGSQADIIAANAQIDANCSFPDAVTTTWALPLQAYNQNFWFIQMPPANGYSNGAGSWAQSQMINGVSNVSIQESQPNWWPPLPTGAK